MRCADFFEWHLGLMLAQILGASPCFWFDNQTQKSISGVKETVTRGGGRLGCLNISGNKPLFSNFYPFFPKFSAYFSPHPEKKYHFSYSFFLIVFAKTVSITWGGGTTAIIFTLDGNKRYCFLNKKEKDWLFLKPSGNIAKLLKFKD